ncbi:MAG: methyltransferase domain-containing protein [Alphaproteobacteria bacterium]|nr:methyltransferase domain-containing protein [Alphaproteobacteria bacterium]
MPANDYSETAGQYGSAEFVGVIYLAFRDVPALIAEHVDGVRALDYGCGAGRSTRLLKRQGLEATGVDISGSMLAEARRHDPSGDYRQIDSGRLPFDDGSFDLAFSSFVFFEIPSLDEMARVAAEIRRVLRPGGVLILLIGADELYDHEWTTVKVDFPENRTRRSGDAVRVYLTDIGLELVDYYWTDADYRQMFARAGLTVERLHQPLGTPADGIDWITEDKVPPFSLYVARK